MDGSACPERICETILLIAKPPVAKNLFYEQSIHKIRNVKLNPKWLISYLCILNFPNETDLEDFKRYD